MIKDNPSAFSCTHNIFAARFQRSDIDTKYAHDSERAFAWIKGNVSFTLAQMPGFCSKCSSMLVGTPNDVIFGRNPLTAEEVTWGQVRQTSDEMERLRYLTWRLRTFLVVQYDELLSKNVSGPFTVATVTLTGIGSMAEIFYKFPKPTNSSTEEREIFGRFCSKVAQQFGRSPPLKFKEAFTQRWAVERPERVADILYTFFRNTLVHGYYGKAVFVTGDGTSDIELRDDGCVLLHPTWFLRKFICAVERHCDDLMREEENGLLRKNALTYLRGLLDEKSSSDCPQGNDH